MINPIRNQRGIAIVATLVMMVLAVGVVAILYRLATQETKLASLEQGYTAALDAAKGGTDLFIYMAQNIPSASPAASYVTPAGFGTVTNSNCLKVKMTNSTASWTGNANWSAAACGATQAQATGTNPTSFPDMALNLNNGAIPYTVYVKIIDNYPSAANSTSPTCPVGCYYFTVVARAQPQWTSKENEYAEVFFVYRISQ